MNRGLRVAVSAALLVLALLLIVWGVAVILTEEEGETFVVIADREADPEFAGAASIVLALSLSALATCILRCGGERFANRNTSPSQ
jgi:hypothetical protein